MSEYAARVSYRDFDGEFHSFFFFIELMRSGNARTTRRKPAKEARVQSYPIKIFVVRQGKDLEWFSWMVVAGNGYIAKERERERKSGRYNIIKETRSTRRFFLVNFTNTCYYISLIFSIIISNISCGYNLL